MFKQITEGERYPKGFIFGAYSNDFACLGLRIPVPWKTERFEYHLNSLITKHWKLCAVFYRHDKDYPIIGFSHWYE